MSVHRRLDRLEHLRASSSPVVSAERQAELAQLTIPQLVFLVQVRQRFEADGVDAAVALAVELGATGEEVTLIREALEGSRA